MFRPHCDHRQANIHSLSAFNVVYLCMLAEDAVETCSQKILNILAITIVYFIILSLCLM